MGDIRELEQQLFNMKLKVHEYEQRLEKVRLHGLTGETLQKQNVELREQLEVAESTRKNNLEKISSLTEICMKTKHAIEKLQTENLQLSHSVQREVEEHNKTKWSLQNNEQKRKRMEEQIAILGELKPLCKEQKDQIAILRKERESVTEMVKEHARQIEHLEKIKKEYEISQKNVFELKAKNDSLNQELHRAQQTIKSLRLEHTNLKNDTQKELELRRKEITALYNDKFVILEKRIDGVKRDKRIMQDAKIEADLECERLRKRYKALDDKCTKLNIELINVQNESNSLRNREEIAQYRIREKYEKEIAELENSYSAKFEEMKKSLSQKLKDKQKIEINLREQIKKVNDEMKSKLVLADKRTMELQSELDKVRKKWRDSIINKRALKNVKNRQSVDIPVQSRVGREIISGAGQASSEISATAKRRRDEPKAKVVASRFMHSAQS